MTRADRLRRGARQIGRTGLRRRVLLVAAVAVAAVGVANAATVGPVTSTRLDGFVGSAPSGANAVYAADNFTGPAGSDLDGRALVNGRTWVVHAGTWRLNGANQVTVAGVPDGRAVTETGQADGRVVVTTTDAPAGGRDSGVVFRSDTTGTRYLSVHTETPGGGRIRLVRHDGTATVLATSGRVSLSSPALWAVELDGASIRVFYNGALAIDHTLTGRDLTTFGGLTSHGMLNDDAGTVVFDDFRFESL